MNYDNDDFIDHEDYSGDEYLTEEESYRRYRASSDYDGPDEDDEEWPVEPSDEQPEINEAIEDMQTDN
jgi:hypothetical protein